AVMVEPDTDVTLPVAPAKLAGRVIVGRDPATVVRVVNVPPPRPGKPPPPPKRAPPKPTRHLPAVGAEIEMVVALSAPFAPLIPVARIHFPAATALKPTATVA